MAALSVRNRVSRRDVVELAEELFAARISTGTVEAILARASEALAKPHEDLLARVRAAQALNVDETGWRTAGERRALWGAFTKRHAFFAVAPDRHEEHAKSLLADTNAIVTSDRWWAYTHLPLARRQICWSHLKRDFAAHAEGLAAEKEFGEAGLELCAHVFWAWEVFAHTHDRRELKRTVRSLQRTYKPIIRSFASKRARNKRCRGMARNLLKAWPACGLSPHTRASSRPTTTPSALCAARSSTASSRSAPNPSRESDASRGSSQHTPPAGSSTARCSPTSANSSPLTHAAIPRQHSHERHRLNATD